MPRPIFTLMTLLSPLLLKSSEGKSLFPYYHESIANSFQDLVPNPQIYRTIRTGYAPIIRNVLNEGSQNRNILLGFEDTLKELRCSVVSSPSSQFKWKYRGQEIILGNASNPVSVNESVNLSILKVKVQESTLGEYTCRAENALGAAEANYFVGRAAKPPMPLFNTTVVPNSGILVQVIGFQRPENLHTLQAPQLSEKQQLGEILPVKGYVIQIRVMRSCDEWTNITSHSEKHFIRSHLISGTVYRIRLATMTEAGVGEFCRAKTVYYSLSDEIEEDGDISTSTRSNRNARSDLYPVQKSVQTSLSSESRSKRPFV